MLLSGEALYGNAALALGDTSRLTGRSNLFYANVHGSLTVAACVQRPGTGRPASIVEIDGLSQASDGAITIRRHMVQFTGKVPDKNAACWNGCMYHVISPRGDMRSFYARPESAKVREAWTVNAYDERILTARSQDAQQILADLQVDKPRDGVRLPEAEAREAYALAIERGGHGRLDELEYTPLRIVT